MLLTPSLRSSQSHLGVPLRTRASYAEFARSKVTRSLTVQTGCPKRQETFPENGGLRVREIHRMQRMYPERLGLAY
jgi:hypothetical protein